MAFLASIEFERTQPCLANPERMIIVGRPSRELTPVLPYLAGLPNLLAWNPSLPSVTLRRAEGFITLTNQEVLITQVEDLEEGVRLLTVLADAINATWDRREELVAMQARRQAPRPLDVWHVLPQTNCRACGLPTCMAFAFALLQHTAELAACPALGEGEGSLAARSTIESML
jgi:ArsR family metal-binding transcriptional regulator